MAELTARNLKRAGIQSLLITSRTFDNAVALARKLDGTAVPFDNFRPYLKLADVVIASRRLGVDQTTDRFRQAGVTVYARILNAIMGQHLTDSSNG